MQLIAMLTMLADHIGYVFFPERMEWRIIGRLAFPLYAYALAIGYSRTSNVNRYMLRLALIGALAQYPFMAAFHTTGINAIGTLLIGLCTVAWLDRCKLLHIQAFLVIASAALLEWFHFDYGAYGLLLILIFRYSTGHSTVVLHVLLNLLFTVWKGWFIITYNMFSTIAIVYTPMLFRTIERIRIPKWLWRSFYPAHLAVLAAMRQLL